MFDLQLTDHANRLHLQVTDELSVGPPGNVFLFGGVGHAAAIKALKQVTGREIIWSTAQFSSFARRGACLDLEVEVKTAGYNTTQAQVVATCLRRWASVPASPSTSGLNCPAPRSRMPARPRRSGPGRMAPFTSAWTSG